MKSKNILIFFTILVLIFASAFVMFQGVSFGHYEFLPVEDAINYGLDLTGGVYVVLEAKDTTDDPLTDEKIERAIATIRERIDSLGVSEPTIAKQGEKRIRVSIPNIQNQQEALDLIGKTAQLEFVDPNGEVVLTGEHIEESNAVYQNDSNGMQEAVVTLKFNDEGTEAFARATEEFLNQVIEIKLDGEAISSPVVNSVITGGEAYIEGMADLEEAGNIAMLIRAGALPVELEPVEVRTIGPTLGQNSLEKSIQAAGIGILLILLFMLLYYRVPGFIADIALIAYILLTLLVITGIGVTLTLPGIAGMILSIGMAVDANVIIFERIKEELKLGKSLLASVDAGFSKAFSTIFDSNLTTFIAGMVLFIFGSGSVKGFAITLMIGIALSMFTALFITKRLLKSFIKCQLIKSTKLYGA
ncbi:MAG: protein translocase subunit SecD [Eubacteriaceae bacterium]